MSNEINKHKEEKDLKDIVNDYLQYWYLFVLGLVLALGIAYVYLRYSTPRYLAQASVLIKDENDMGLTGDLQSIFRFSGFSNRFLSGRMENEVAVFKSKQLISEAIKTLNLNISYETVGTIKSSELYHYKPITVNYLSFDQPSQNNPVPALSIKILSTSEYEMALSGKNNGKTYSFGETVSLGFGDILVLPEFDATNPKAFDKYIGNTITVRHRSIENTAIQYQRRLRVNNEIKNSNVVILSVQSAVRPKAKDFLNELVRQYNMDASRDRNAVAENTASFIDSRLDIISRELDSVELGKAAFKSENRLTDIISEAQLTLENTSNLDARQLDLGTQVQLIDYVLDYMDQHSIDSTLPSNVGLDDVDTQRAVSRYNNLVLERNRLLRNSTPQNPVIATLNNELEGMRSGILESLRNQKRSLEIASKDISTKESLLEAKIRKVPTQEKIFRSIERQQTVKEQLYLFLLQQREQTSIALSIKSDKAKIVDSAYSSKVPVYPNKRIIYMASGLAGIAIPFGLLYLFFLFNTKVQNTKDIEMALSDIPMVGEIPKLGKQDNELIGMSDRSIMAESFRILRTNLQYVFAAKRKKNSEKTNNTIFVTSTVKGEGKTFVAFNMALSFALAGKKTLLVGADIRNPQIHRYLDIQAGDRPGFTNYIVDESTQIEDLVIPSQLTPDLSIILSGPIPPNPAELLLQDRTGEFFRKIKTQYEYVIVDSAPAMLVTDTFLLKDEADVTAYVFRAGLTEKSMLGFCGDAARDERLSNVVGILNAVDSYNYAYGNKYGYAYTDKRNKRYFWQRLGRR